jgi:hypothetical protein
MSEEKIKATVVDENPSIAEKEEAVLENAGVSTKESDGTWKVDLSKQPENNQDAVQEQSTDEVPVRDEPEVSGEVQEENVEETVEESSGENQEEEETLIELVEDEEPQSETKEQITQPEPKQPEPVAEQQEIPEGLEDLVKFMNETGGTIEDYARLNADYSNVDNQSLLREYYKQTKPHLDNDEINFLLEDNFSFDEEIDEERDVRRKKLAYKEEVAKAKNFLEGLKDKYYKEVKLTSKLSPDQKEAIDFYNKYQQEQSQLQEVNGKASENFTKLTKNLFNEDFKGFDFKVADKKYRFKVKDPMRVQQNQSDISQALGKFLDGDGLLKDAAGYHKALFTGLNADQIASHFYEQGKADAIRNVKASSKNINMDARPSGTVEAGGIKVRAITGDSSSKLKIKLNR